LTARMASKTVVFQRPFVLPGLEGLQPAGSYVVETEEELLDMASFVAWKRVATAIKLISAGSIEYWPIDPGKLNEALQRDRAWHDSPVATDSAVVRRDGECGDLPPKRATQERII
jgi:hypothetical protein